MLGIGDHAAVLRGYGYEVVGEGRSQDSRKEVVVQGEVTGVGPVIGDIALVHLGVGMFYAERERPGKPIKGVHAAVIGGLGGGGGTVSDVRIHLIRRLHQPYGAARGRAAGGGSVGSGEAAEIIIEGVIFLNDEDDVVYLREPRSLRRRLRS